MTPNERDILLVACGQFAARHDAYVRDSRAHIPEPLTVEVVAAAFGGGFSVSGYMSHRPTEGVPDTTHIGAIDFDMTDGLDRARAVRALLRTHDVGSLVVGSRRGAHLWVTFDPVSSSLVRRALRAGLKLAGADDPKAEVFPKASRSLWGVGALRMPLMRHPKSGVRYPAYGPRDEPLDRLQDVLLAFPQTTVEALRAFAGSGESHSLPPAATDGYRLLRRASSDSQPRASALLAMIGVTGLPGRSVRCPFHDDQHASLSIADDDLRVWCKSPECPLYTERGMGIGSIALEALMRKEPPRASVRPPDTHGLPDRLRQ